MFFVCFYIFLSYFQLFPVQLSREQSKFGERQPVRKPKSVKLANEPHFGDFSGTQILDCQHARALTSKIGEQGYPYCWVYPLQWEWSEVGEWFWVDNWYHSFWGKILIIRCRKTRKNQKNPKNSKTIKIWFPSI